MNILFLNPPFLKRYSRESRSPAVAKSGTLYYPMWLCYAAALCEKAGFEIDVVDAAPLNIPAEEIIENRIQKKPDIVVIDTSTPGIYSEVGVGEVFKRAFPDAKVILIGPHVSALPEETLKLSELIDAVAWGPADFIVRDYALALEKREDLSKVRGLVWRENGLIKRNAGAREPEDLDSIPFVTDIYRRFLSIEDYFYGHSRHPLVVVTTGRGCNFNCTYCVLPQTMHRGRYRFRSPENVVREFRFIHENFSGIKEIMIEDDTLTQNRKRLREICEMLIEEGLTRIPWSANSRADVDFETLKIMKRAGLRLLCVGFESGTQKILDNIKKGIRLERFYQFAKDAKRAGVMIHGCFMVGNRGETKETMGKTLDLALKLSPDTAQFFPIMVYPGTEDYLFHMEAGNLVTENFRDWLTVDGLHRSVVNIPGLTHEEMVDFCDWARRKFYLRPTYILNKAIQGIIKPSELKRNIMGAKSLLRYIFRK